MLLEPVEGDNLRIKFKTIQLKRCDTRKFCKHHDALRLTALVNFGKRGRSARRVPADDGAASQATGMEVPA
jgi:hypothetical protein